MTKATFDKLIPLIQAQIKRERSNRKTPFFLQLDEDDYIDMAAQDVLYENKIITDRTSEARTVTLLRTLVNELLKRGIIRLIIAGSYGKFYLTRAVSESEDTFEKRVKYMLRKTEKLHTDIEFAATCIFSQVRFVVGSMDIRIQQIEEHAKMWGIKAFSGRDILNQLAAMDKIKIHTASFPGEGPRSTIYQKDENESEEAFDKRVQLETNHALKVSKKRLVSKLTKGSPEKNHLRNLKEIANSLPDGPEKAQAFREYSSYKRQVVKKLVKDVYRFVESTEVQSF